MPLQLEDLAPLDSLAALERPTQAIGSPLMLPLDLIDEDPAQPRTEFDEDSLRELAATIAERGVRQPISVRPHPVVPGRWMLNFGARRLRASKIAGRTEIPAFVDEAADSFDQVIENEQRDALRPIDLALFVQKRIALGDSQAEIAKRLGKSRQWVTLATALIQPPDWLLQAYREDRCRGINELYDLRRLHGKYGQAVEAWATQHPNITRDRLTELRATLERSTAAPSNVVIAMQSSTNTAATGTDASSGMARHAPSRPVVPALATAGRSIRSSLPDAAQRPDQRVHVEFEGHDYLLVVSVVPDQAGCMYVRPLTGGPSRLAPAAALKLLGFVIG